MLPPVSILLGYDHATLGLELLQQGWANMSAFWIDGSVVAAMTFTLITVTFIGEAIREAFDPKRHTMYE